MTEWDESYDLVAIGSGGGGLVAGITASEAGLKALVIEKRDLIGGSTSMSGGVMWLPNNPLMQNEGIADSDTAALDYFESVVGDVGPASSKERRHALLTGGRDMVAMLQRLGIGLVRCPGYSDYYSDHPGGHAAGRSIEPAPFDGNALGEWLPRVQPGMAAGIGLTVKTNELRSVQFYNRSVSSLTVAARVWLRTMLGKLRRQSLLTNGTALVAQLVRAAVGRGVDIWTETPLDDLVTEGGRVVGVRVVRDGVPVNVEARQGVVIAAGGFAHNRAMRTEHGGSQTPQEDWSMANPGDTGEALSAAMALGAQTALMDEAWWLPSPSPLLATSTLNVARQRPGSILVDAAGERFVNESNSYVEVGKAMFARDKTVPAVPSWLIIDDGYRRRYANAKSLPGRLDQAWLDSGALKRADTLDELAKECDIDPAGLRETVERFNAHATRGEDPDYHRGESAYNRCLGDPGRVPNPCLAPLDRAPYYAAQIFPADVGTCGGLLADEHARVIDQAGAAIPGLYATGNCTATVMGRHYLGAGASIGYTMVFGYLAARHSAGRAHAPES